eukprot:2594554-Lingulodinium_polyedra.AAC.1
MTSWTLKRGARGALGRSLARRTACLLAPCCVGGPSRRASGCALRSPVTPRGPHRALPHCSE